MDYEPYDSSGTDDDLPPPHQGRIPTGDRIGGTGMPHCSGSVPFSRMHVETDMKTQIHQLEQEAYSAVLRAFKAQSDAITWEKESLITELRKELNLSNEEHRQLLNRVNADDVIRRIREWRRGGGNQAAILNTNQNFLDPIPSPTVSTSLKKSKINESVPSQSFGGPSPSVYPQARSASHQPSPTVKRGAFPGSRGKKHKPYLFSGPGGRNQVSSRASAGAVAIDPAEGAALVGRAVRTRWPDDNNFYEAVIADYNAAEGRHALVYDMHTPNEAWEWVNLSEIASEDIQWVGEDPALSRQRGFGGAGRGINRTVGHDHIPSAGRGRPASRKNFPPSQSGIGKKDSDQIKVLITDTIVKEVERVFNSTNPDPMEMQKAKKLLQDQEQSLVDAIAKLGEISDGDDSGHGQEFSLARSMTQG